MRELLIEFATLYPLVGIPTAIIFALAYWLGKSDGHTAGYLAGIDKMYEGYKELIRYKPNPEIDAAEAKLRMWAAQQQDNSPKPPETIN